MKKQLMKQEISKIPSEVDLSCPLRPGPSINYRHCPSFSDASPCLSTRGGLCSPCMSTRSDNARVELLQGTLDLLILRTLVLGPVHGHAIAKAIERNSEDVLVVEQGSLYPALHRLMKRNLVSAEDGISENNRKARFYRLTAKGRKRLSAETSKWERFSSGIARLLSPLPD